MPDNTLLWLRGGTFFALLLTASIADLKHRIVPNRVCAAIALTGLFPLEANRLSGIFCALPLLTAALTCGGMGGGDIKLMAAAGIVLGISGGFAATFLGLSAMLLFYAACRVVSRLCVRECPKAFPLAPFLSAGCMAVYFLNETGGIPNI